MLNKTLGSPVQQFTERALCHDQVYAQNTRLVCSPFPGVRDARAGKIQRASRLVNTWRFEKSAVFRETLEAPGPFPILFLCNFPLLFLSLILLS